MAHSESSSGDSESTFERYKYWRNTHFQLKAIVPFRCPGYVRFTMNEGKQYKKKIEDIKEVISNPTSKDKHLYACPKPGPRFQRPMSWSFCEVQLR